MSPPNEYTTVISLMVKGGSANISLGKTYQFSWFGLCCGWRFCPPKAGVLFCFFFYFPASFCRLITAAICPCWAFIAAKAFSDISWKLIDNKTPAGGSKLLHCLENDFVVSNRSVANICLGTCVTCPNAYCITWCPWNIHPHKSWLQHGFIP